MMRKMIVSMSMFSCFCLSCPAIAKTISITQYIDVGSQYARSFLGQEKYSAGFYGIPVGINSGDVVEGTVWFTGGHVTATDKEKFFIYGASASPDSAAYILSRDIYLLDVQGREFGARKRFPYNYGGWTGYAQDDYYLAAYNPYAESSFDVYGVRYRVAFGRVSPNVGHDNGTFRYDPTIVAGNYAEGDVFTSAVPEPSSWAMMALGFAGLGLAMRRRKIGAVALA